MNTPKLAIAMNYIDENLISGAIDYKPVTVRITLIFGNTLPPLPVFVLS